MHYDHPLLPLRGVAPLLLGTTLWLCAGSGALAQSDGVSRLDVLIEEFTDLRGNAFGAATALPPSFEEVDRRAYRARALITKLKGLDRSALDAMQQQTVDLMLWDARSMTEEPSLFWYDSPLMPSLSPLRGVRESAQAAPLTTPEEGLAYLEIMHQAAAALDWIHKVERGRLTRAIVLPREQIDRVLPLLRGFAADPRQHPLWPTDDRLQDWREADTKSLRQFLSELANVLGREVTPRAAAVSHFVDQTLRHEAPEAVGMAQYPGGREAYAKLVRAHTTLDITAEEVHEIGLRGVAELNEQMAALRGQLNWRGTKAQFHDFLREDGRFYVDEPEQFGERLLAFDARLRPLIDRQFGHQPEAGYTVRRLDPALEGSMTYGFFSVPTPETPTGYYNYNGSKLDERSLLSGAALTYHELVPGHHFQISIQMENEDLPEFRRYGYYSGYGEGWGEYSSSVVARELGMYEDPYDLYGRLVFDMFFCVRLVVDTGMNHYGWSRERAMSYMAEHTLESKTQIDSETIRYSMRTPGQALAYRMGLETWRDLRARAERELGERFDVRRFHDSALRIGSVPLTVLEAHVDRFIQTELAQQP